MHNLLTQALQGQGVAQRGPHSLGHEDLVGPEGKIPFDIEPLLMHCSKRDIDKWDTYRQNWKNNKDVEEAMGSFDRYSRGDSYKIPSKTPTKAPSRESASKSLPQ
jgi:hypothetical protein